MLCVSSMARNFGARVAENWICNSKQVLPERKMFKARQPHFPQRILHPGALFRICFCEVLLRCAAVSSILLATVVIKCPAYFGFWRCHQLSYETLGKCCQSSKGCTAAKSFSYRPYQILTRNLTFFYPSPTSKDHAAVLIV